MDWKTVIADIRRRRNWKVEAVAGELGVRPSTVYRWLKGDNQPPARMLAKLQALSQPPVDVLMRGLVEHVDAVDAYVTLLDGRFRIVSTSRPHRKLSTYDLSEITGRSCEFFWSSDMEAIIAAIGGLKAYRERGIVRMDLKLEMVRDPGQPGYLANTRQFTVGSTVTVGDPRDPIGYLTTMKIEQGGEPMPPRIRCLDSDWELIPELAA